MSYTNDLGATIDFAVVGGFSPVAGRGQGSWPLLNRDRLAQAADRAMGMAAINNETADAAGLKALRDGLRAMRPTDMTRLASGAYTGGTVVAGSTVKALLDLAITNANRERRLNEALMTFWPGATYKSLATDLVGGLVAAPGTINVTAYKSLSTFLAPPKEQAPVLLKYTPTFGSQPKPPDAPPPPPTKTNVDLVTSPVPGTEAPVTTSDLVPPPSTPTTANQNVGGGFPWLYVGIGGAVVVGGGAWYMSTRKSARSTPNRRRRASRRNKRTSRKA